MNPQQVVNRLRRLATTVATGTPSKAKTVRALSKLAGSIRMASNNWATWWTVEDVDYLLREGNPSADYSPGDDLRLEAELAKFGQAVENALHRWVGANPGAMVDEHTDAEDILIEDHAMVDVYHTLAESGVGVWDGRWDHFFSAEGHAGDLSDFLARQLSSFVNPTGSGSLANAIDNYNEAAHTVKESSRRAGRHEVKDASDHHETLAALLATDNPPANYGLTEREISAISTYFDWDTAVSESNWSRGTDYETVADMVRAEPAGFLADISRYYGDDYYL